MSALRPPAIFLCTDISIAATRSLELVGALGVAGRTEPDMVRHHIDALRSHIASMAASLANYDRIAPDRITEELTRAEYERPADVQRALS